MISRSLTCFSSSGGCARNIGCYENQHCILGSCLLESTRPWGTGIFERDAFEAVSFGIKLSSPNSPWDEKPNHSTPFGIVSLDFRKSSEVRGCCDEPRFNALPIY